MQEFGVLNYLYTFFFDWLFNGEPLSVFGSMATDFTTLLSVVFCLIGVIFAFRLVTSLIKLVFNMFRLE